MYFWIPLVFIGIWGYYVERRISQLYKWIEALREKVDDGSPFEQ